MATQALYLKYRPQTFDETVGQEPVVRTLRNALRRGRISHAYLLTGPRGTGKTTVARLMAKAVNCLAPEAERPCNRCDICLAITEGRLLDLIEIDAASNRGIDEIRDIREKVGFRPNQARYKVYVLDEAHMLTDPAFNALLKTLEEPPPHVIFALVTTDPHKLPATITSRCQRHDFRRISLQAIVDRLAFVAGQEGLDVEPAALELIAQQSTGALRDALSLLDQLTAYGDETISLALVQDLLGAVTSEAAVELVRRLIARDPAAALDQVDRVVGEGADPRQYARQVVEVLRGLLLLQTGAGPRLLQATAEQTAGLQELAGRIGTPWLLAAIRLFNTAAWEVRAGLQTLPQLPLELACVELTLGAEGTGRQGKEEQVGAVVLERRAESVSRPAPSIPAPTPAQETASVPVALPVPTDGLSLALVEAAWRDLLAAVRDRNPATQGSLNSGCKPVEVAGNLVTITFPYHFLQSKLDDPQRKAEVAEAFSQVLGLPCQVRYVLEGDFSPSPPAASPPGEGELAEITRWAEAVGGQARLIS